MRPTLISQLRKSSYLNVRLGAPDIVINPDIECSWRFHNQMRFRSSAHISECDGRLIFRFLRMQFQSAHEQRVGWRIVTQGQIEQRFRVLEILLG